MCGDDRVKRITHVCLLSNYTDGLTYQDNMLSYYHRQMGFDVTVLASTQMYVNGELVETGTPERYDDDNGIHVARIKYAEPIAVCRITKRFAGLIAELERAAPDLLFIHGLGMHANQDIKKYLISHPNVIVFADTHADYYNSARNWLSKNLLHRIMRRRWTQHLDRYVSRYFGVSKESCEFASDLYGIPLNRIDLLPLGADDINMPGIAESKALLHDRYSIPESNTILVTGGKLDAGKGVIEVMQAVKALDLPNVTLLIFGNVMPDIQNEFFKLIGDNARYAGWIPGCEINTLLRGSDLGIFPGTQSAIWMQAVVCGLPCIFRKWEKGSNVDIGGNCLFVDGTDPDEISCAIKVALSNMSSLKENALSDERYRYGYSRISKQAIGL